MKITQTNTKKTHNNPKQQLTHSLSPTKNALCFLEAKEVFYLKGLGETLWGDKKSATGKRVSDLTRQDS